MIGQQTDRFLVCQSILGSDLSFSAWIVARLSSKRETPYMRATVLVRPCGSGQSDVTLVILIWCQTALAVYGSKAASSARVVWISRSAITPAICASTAAARSGSAARICANAAALSR